MDKVKEIKTVDRPEVIALINAIEKDIADIADGKMTPVEVLGVLDLVKNLFYKNYF